MLIRVLFIRFRLKEKSKSAQRTNKATIVVVIVCVKGVFMFLLVAFVAASAGFVRREYAVRVVLGWKRTKR